MICTGESQSKLTTEAQRHREERKPRKTQNTRNDNGGIRREFNRPSVFLLPWFLLCVSAPLWLALMYLGIEIGGTKLQVGLGPGDGTLAGLWRGVVNVAEGPEGIRGQIS